MIKMMPTTHSSTEPHHFGAETKNSHQLTSVGLTQEETTGIFRTFYQRQQNLCGNYIRGLLIQVQDHTNPGMAAKIYIIPCKN